MTEIHNCGCGGKKPVPSMSSEEAARIEENKKLLRPILLGKHPDFPMTLTELVAELREKSKEKK